MRANHHKVHGEVTCEFGHGNISLHAPHPGSYYEDPLPWAVLATLNVIFHFNGKRQRHKVLKARVQLGMKEPVGYQLTDAYGMAREMLVHELIAHGVTDVFASDLDLRDCGITRWTAPEAPTDDDPFGLF